MRTSENPQNANFAKTEFYEVREESCNKYCIWGMRCPFFGEYGAIIT
jgi:hypothetical protein